LKKKENEQAEDVKRDGQKIRNRLHE